MSNSEILLVKGLIKEATDLIKSHNNQEVTEFSVTWSSQYNPDGKAIMLPNLTIKLTESRYS